MIDEPIDPDDRADWLVEQGRVDEAITEYGTAIAEGDAAAGAGLAEVYARAGQLDEAVRAYRPAMDAEGVSRWPWVHCSRSTAASTRR